MPKATLEFDLPEESEEFKDAQNGTRYKIVIGDIFAKIRALEKYHDKRSLTIDEIREMIVEIIKDNEVDVP